MRRIVLQSDGEGAYLMTFGRAGQFMKMAAGRIRAAVALLLLAGIVASASPAFPGPLSILNGLVERVDGNEIRVHSRYYDTSTAVIKDPSGRILSAGDVAPRAKVSLFFRSGRLQSVVVYPFLPE
jgi:hypothetical protein